MKDLSYAAAAWNGSIWPAGAFWNAGRASQRSLYATRFAWFASRSVCQGFTDTDTDTDIDADTDAATDTDADTERR